MQTKSKPRLITAANENDPTQRDAEPKAAFRRNYLVLVAAIIGAGLFYWLATLFVDWDRIQTCVMMGKRNCIPPIELNHR